MVKWLAKNKCAETRVEVGDTVVVRHRRDGVLLNKIEVDVTEALTYNTIAIGVVEDELGFERALVGALGWAA